MIWSASASIHVRQTEHGPTRVRQTADELQNRFDLV